MGGIIKPSLIQTTTKTRNLTPDVLRDIANLVLHIQFEVFPSTKHFSECFPCREGPLADLLKEFDVQLGLTSNEDIINDFWIPGLAIIIPSLLRPHYDRLDPSTFVYDVTCQINVLIPMTNVNPIYHDQLKKEFGEDVKEIPMSFLFYPVNALWTMKISTMP